MQEDISHLTIEELAELVDIPVRTVRYYIGEGLLPGPEGRGKAATYSDEHLQRLRLIRLLSNQHRPLAEIHQLLDRLSLPEIRTLLAEEEQRARELEPASPQEYIATLLKNAQINRSSRPQAPAFPSAPATPQAPMGDLEHASISQRPDVPEAQKVREHSSIYESMSSPVPEMWKRWELAPGIELHVKEGVAEQQRDLLERICRVAGIPFQ